METRLVANRILWGVWQVDRPRPVGRGAGNRAPGSHRDVWHEQ
jgi:hypothetical protein